MVNKQMRRAAGYIFYALIISAFVVAMVAELWVGTRPTCTVCVPAPKDSVEIVIVGDVMAHLPQVESARVGEEAYDFTPHFEGVRPLFGAADYVVANLETTLSPRPPYSGYPSFSTPEQLARDLAAVGVDAVTLANNHITDKGAEGVLHTLAALDNAGVDYVGVGVPAVRAGRAGGFIARVGSFRVAFVAATDLLNRPAKGVDVAMLDTLTQGQKVDSVRDRADLVVALVHWGEEYHRLPSQRQKTLAKWMRSRGVDVVVGSHPHVIQPFEVERNEEGRTVGAVFYSLGNFISNQNDVGTDRGVAVRIGLHRKSAVGSIDLTIEADTIHRVRYTEGSKTHYELKMEN